MDDPILKPLTTGAAVARLTAEGLKVAATQLNQLVDAYQRAMGGPRWPRWWDRDLLAPRRGQTISVTPPRKHGRTAWNVLRKEMEERQAALGRWADDGGKP